MAGDEGRPKPVPRPTPDTAPYWDGAAAGELRVPRCRPCGEAFLYPRPHCPVCSSDDIEWFTASGRATLHSYLIAHIPAPGFEDEVPYAVAVVELEEGPRLMSGIVEVPNDPEHLVLDMELEVVFDRHGDVAVPKFRPRGGAR
ncbi:DNA-binding protein [Sphaerisporangium rufum]|uniref:DNA-binding protein n=1 Tax=Sphaerisporangium rufum TaxID=1381558 RepID=A0A919R7F0_9ACTN|nr:OB-fold domain-containing protein [Sphaerisporangium rufum]GII78562.1 DNA-binding protein [Sphaerisporangium rufum]